MQHSPKMAPKMDSPFSRIWSKMGSNCDIDPKMAPRDAGGPQDGTEKHPKMIPQLSKTLQNGCKWPQASCHQKNFCIGVLITKQHGGGN